MGWKYKYSHIPLLLSLRPTPRILLGRKLYWTIKEDGECISIWRNKNQCNHEEFVQVSSRNKLDAQQDILHRVQTSEDYINILLLLEENPQFVIYVEECSKGRSITGIKTYPRTMLILFDIYDRDAKKFLPYVNVYQHAFHHKIPIVKLYAETRHSSMRDLLKFKNHVLAHCHALKEEGIVVKTYTKQHGYVQAKVKIDIPEPTIRKIQKGNPVYPVMPENEAFGAIDKVYQDLGVEKFQDVRVAMPLVAKAVKKECKKHLFVSPTQKLFALYEEFKERMILER